MCESCRSLLLTCHRVPVPVVLPRWQTKNALRSVRKQGLDQLKKLKGSVSDDDLFRYQKQVGAAAPLRPHVLCLPVRRVAAVFAQQVTCVPLLVRSLPCECRCKR